MDKGLKDFAAQLIEAAKKAGAQQADVLCVKRSGLNASVFGGEIDEFLRTGSNGAGLRVIKDNKAGYAYTEKLSDADEVAGLALSNAAIADADTNIGIYEGSHDYPKAAPGEPIPDSSDIVNIAMELYDYSMGIQYAHNVQMCAAEAEQSQIVVANSAGALAEHFRSDVVIAVDVVARRDDWTESGFSFDVGKSLAGLDVRHTAEDAMHRALEYYGAGGVASGNYPVVIRKEAAKDLLEAFLPIFSAQKAQYGLSMLAGKEGEQIASPMVSIVDDPLNPDLPYTRPFDGEGVPCARMDIVHEGKLQTLLHNLRTARKAGVQPTGHAGRGYSSTVDISPSNFYIQNGSSPYTDLLNAAGSCVVVSEVSGLHAGVNAVSGDFSLLAKGFEVQGGQYKQPLTQLVVSGNIYALLKDIAMVGDDLYFGYPAGGSFGSPSVFVPSLAIAGK